MHHSLPRLHDFNFPLFQYKKYQVKSHYLTFLELILYIKDAFWRPWETTGNDTWIIYKQRNP